MPIWLRNYTYNLIKEHYENETKVNEPVKDKGLPQGPDISPSYSTKASTK